MSATAPIPSGFWAQIDHQLARIAEQKPGTFDAVRQILLDDAYDQVVTENNRNGVRHFDDDSAFFAGSGGDATLFGALLDAGWRVTAYDADYFYVLAHELTGEVLTYIEGDVERGNQLS